MGKCDAALWFFVNFSVLFLCNNSIGVMAQEEASCYGSGSIALSVILTLVIGALLAVMLFFIWHKYIKPKKGQHLILETDPEKGKGEYAFDNPGFKDAGLTPAGKTLEKNKAESGNKTKWNQWSPLGVLTLKNEKKRTLDDSAIQDLHKIVTLRSHDFTGLGFNICGNMKEGIFIKDILHRGPASESGKLNSGDRINSVTISFEHMVYEDALAILSYASPYEVIISAKNGKAVNYPGPAGRPAHPVYRSSSTMDLNHVEKSSKKRLFQPDDSSEIGSNYSSLQKTRSTATTLERTKSKSPKPSQKLLKPKNKLSPDQLKQQLEQNIVEDYKETLRMKNDLEVPQRVENEQHQKAEAQKHHKFGIQVLPMDNREHTQQQRSPKSAELSQNDNNINLEKSDAVQVPITSIDEVDRKLAPPPVKKREKINQKPVPDDSFKRGDDLNGSGIRRDENNIPLEIPNNMMSAAMAARRNRKSVEEEDIRSPKKLKGKAPAPPPETLKGEDSNFDEIYPLEDDGKLLIVSRNLNRSDDSIEKMSPEAEAKGDYNSDSDIETDNQSSVNTIELNASDITIHQSEENEEKGDRKTASTGDLSKIHKTRKTSTGTLERAQSLDITDTTIPVLAKKRKAGKIEDSFDSKTSSDESFYGSALINKEPKLSVILDGLNTCQRSRLKKSTEWGNLEDAILNLNKGDGSNEERSNSSYEDIKLSSEDLAFGFDAKTPEFDALVNKIKEIKEETVVAVSGDQKPIGYEITVASGGGKIIGNTNEDWNEKTIREGYAKAIGNIGGDGDGRTSSETIEIIREIRDGKTIPVNHDDAKTIKNQIWPESETPDPKNHHEFDNININKPERYEITFKKHDFENAAHVGNSEIVTVDRTIVDIGPQVKLNLTEIPREKMDVKLNQPKISSEKLDVKVQPENAHGKFDVKFNKPEVPHELLDVKFNKSEITHENLDVKFSKTEMRRENLDVKFNKPEITRESLDVKFNKPEITRESLDVKFNKPEIARENLDFKFKKPEVTRESLDVKFNNPEITRESLDVKFNRPEITREMLDMKYNQSEIAPEIEYVRFNKNELKKPERLNKKEHLESNQHNHGVIKINSHENTKVQPDNPEESHIKLRVDRFEIKQDNQSDIPERSKISKSERFVINPDANRIPESAPELNPESMRFAKPERFEINFNKPSTDHRDEIKIRTSTESEVKTRSTIEPQVRARTEKFEVKLDRPQTFIDPVGIQINEKYSEIKIPNIMKPENLTEVNVIKPARSNHDVKTGSRPTKIIENSMEVTINKATINDNVMEVNVNKPNNAEIIVNRPEANQRFIDIKTSKPSAEITVTKTKESLVVVKTNKHNPEVIVDKHETNGSFANKAYADVTVNKPESNESFAVVRTNKLNAGVNESEPPMHVKTNIRKIPTSETMKQYDLNEIRIKLEKNEKSPDIRDVKTNKPDDPIIKPSNTERVQVTQIETKTNPNIESIAVNTSHKPTIKHKFVKQDMSQVNSFILAEREASNKSIHTPPAKLDDTNVSDDIKVSRHSLGSLERAKSDNVSNITISDKDVETVSFEVSVNKKNESAKNIIVSTPDLIKNITIAEAIHDLNNEVTIEGPSSLTFEIPGEEFKPHNGIKMKSNGDINKMEVPAEEKNSSSLTYITEIQVLTPNNKSSKIEIIPKPEKKNLDNDFESYIKNFESNIKNFENNINSFEQNIQDVTETAMKDVSPAKTSSSITVNEKVDAEKELLKVQEIVEEQLKKLPEMRFTTSSYESQIKPPEKRQSQIEILRSNFEKSSSPPRLGKSEPSPPKSRIPVLNKTPPTSPERRDSKILDTEPDKEILEIMSSQIPMTSSLKYQPKTATRNVTVTSIRSNSKIPSGLPTYNSRPPVPPRRMDSDDGVQVSTNGDSSSFRQWVFNPSDSAVTNITVTETKFENRK